MRRRLSVVLALLPAAIATWAAATHVAGGEPALPQRPATTPTSVLLFADLSEAGASCGCGQIIRAVRAAQARGVPTKEADPRKDSSDLARRYKVLVSPAVLLLDGGGREVRRYEGESAEIIRALTADLDKIPAKKA